MTSFKLPHSSYVRYIKHREQDILALKDSLEKLSIDAFLRIGHQLKGNARSFGFDALEKLGERLEEVSPETLSQDGPELLREFSEWLKKVRPLYPEETVNS